MDEGFEKDDKYRIVEDEFLKVAKKFTVHLHAAEYKRQQKMAKTRNAETINSISRPVTGKMPDQTKRKVEAVARAKKQQAGLQGLLVKSEGPESSDDEGLPYVGTSLHGLMDSPRKKAASLPKSTGTPTTRAAAGYKAQSKGTEIKVESPSRPSRSSNSALKLSKDDSATQSLDDDDDLDAPILAPKFTKSVMSTKIKQEVIHTKSFFGLAANSSSVISQNNVSRTKQFLTVGSKPSGKVQTEIQVKEEDNPRCTSVKRAPIRLESDSPPPAYRSRRYRVRQEEKEDESKAKKLDVIPDFMM